MNTAATHLKVWTDGTDTVIAEDIRAVQKVMEVHAGSWESSDGDWRVIDGAKLIKIHNFTGHEDIVTKTADEWVKAEGRGFLCSTEW